MNEICKKEECTGCAACYNVCTHSAIKMLEDECGYIYPHIDEDICVDCGLCRKICPTNELCNLSYPLSSIAAINKFVEEHKSCASGGIATLLSKAIINKGGIVYGSDGTDVRDVHHVRKNTLESLNDLKGSKYVHSFIGSTYKEVKSDLENGKFVLFIGTPCQVAGLKGFLRNKIYSNLYTVDLVCHGVPSQKMLNDNLNSYVSDDTSVDLSFRKKDVSFVSHKTGRITYGWYLKNKETNIVIEKSSINDPYMLGFLSCLTIRDNCSICRYACIARCSDITLSDYWGLREPTCLKHGKGVSNLLINTEKGEVLWNMIKDQTINEKRTIVEALMGNGRLQAPKEQHSKHKLFKRLYTQIGFVKAVNKCCRKDIFIHYLKMLYAKIV